MMPSSHLIAFTTESDGYYIRVVIILLRNRVQLVAPELIEI
jgi:hypothetical protein